jgi:hypothetical protein
VGVNQDMQLGDRQTEHLFIYLFYLFIFFPYIAFQYIPWKWKISHSIYITGQLANSITDKNEVAKILISYSNNLPKLTLDTKLKVCHKVDKIKNQIKLQSL